MPRNHPTLRCWPVLFLLLPLACGDSVADEGDDEVGDTTTGGETSNEGSDNVEAGSEGNTTSGESEGEGESGSSGTDDETADDETADGSDTGTETEEPIDCTMLDEPTCQGTDACVPYMGLPYTLGGDGTICLGPGQFIGCLFAVDACLPATGTLCMGANAFHVDNLCPPPEGFESCEPPVDPAMPCMP